MSRPSLTTEQVKEVCRRYQAGENSVQLALSLHVSPRTIRAWLERAGTPRRYRPRRYTCDHSYFSAIDTQEKAYWLGFVAADGYVHQRLCLLKLTLASHDASHVQRFAAALQSTYPLHQRRQGSRYSVAAVGVRSATLVAALATWGITQRKSATVPWPAVLRSDLLRHYLRGYVDGNGGFYVYPTGKPTPSFSFSVGSNRSFLQDAQCYLMQHCDLNRTKFDGRRRGASWFALLRYKGRLQVSRIFHLLYDGATVWLPRKREHIEPWID